MEHREIIDPSDLNLKEEVVSINRVVKVVKGGKNLSFVALVVVGDPDQHIVGFAKGKAKEVPSAIRKAIEKAKKNLIRVHTREHTIPHQVLGVFGAGRVLLKPARQGKGMIAGGAVRAVVEAAGIQNVLTKSIGTKNANNVIRATFNGLLQLREKAAVAELRTFAGAPMTLRVSRIWTVFSAISNPFPPATSARRRSRATPPPLLSRATATSR